MTELQRNQSISNEGWANMIDRQLGKEFSKTGYTKTKRVAL